MREDEASCDDRSSMAKLSRLQRFVQQRWFGVIDQRDRDVFAIGWSKVKSKGGEMGRSDVESKAGRG